MSDLVYEKRQRRENGISGLRWVAAGIGLVIIVSGLVVIFGPHAVSFKEVTTALERLKPSVEFMSVDANEAERIRQLGLTPRPKLKIVDGRDEQVLHGRFLHITDIHPDLYYKKGSETSLMCHSGKGDAGKYGDAVSGCDSPIALMEDTLKWIKENLKDKIDFVVWTGDNVRHDNDRRYPRTESNIFEMNQRVSNLMYETFKKENAHDGPARQLQIPLVPSLGNNDVYPHNLFAPGPTLQTRELFKIWQDFIPPSQLHIFNRGASFFQEIIPNELAVLSINTLYLFQSNPLVDSCDKKKDPGYKLFEWLGYTLKEMRARNMKVWLTGHVPPNEKNYDISCLRKYIVWTHEYRDVIIGGLFGHMNIDHFIPLDSKAAYESIKKKFGKLGFDYKLSYEDSLHELDSDPDSGSDSDSDSYDHEEEEVTLEESYAKFRSPIFKDGFDDDVSFENMNKIRIEGGVPNGKVEYMDTVRKESYATVKRRKKRGNASERYSIAHIAASVVPTFNPGLRVWEYNTTNLKNLLTSNSHYRFAPWDEFFLGMEKLIDSQVESDYDDELISFEQRVDIFKKDKTFPPKMPSSKPLGPGYVPQTFTPERYVQYYADLASINKGKKDFAYELEYATDDKIYNMKSLVADDWLALARKLAKPVKERSNGKNGKRKKNKDNGKSFFEDLVTNPQPQLDADIQSGKLERLWKNYLKNSFVSSDYEYMGMG